MSKPISDYALIGDTHSCALIARDGSIDWLCWPRHDSPALFLKLLDEEKGGACSVDFDALTGTARRYVPDTNILETIFTTGSGRARLVDLMPVNPPSPEPDEGPDGEGESRLIRMLTCESGRVSGVFRVRPTFDYARRACTPLVEGASVLFEAGDWRVRVNAHARPNIVEDAAEIRFSLDEGQTAYVVLTHGEEQEDACIENFAGAQRRLEATADYWRRWSDRCTYRGAYRDAVMRSALCLKLLTYSPSGGIVAAATAGLPEAVPGNRNYDYRFTWMRDASFTVTAFVMLGYVREASEFLRFLRERDGTYGRETKLMYGIADGMPPEEELTHLAGWNGVRPVVIGNLAEGQDQHDIYGELLRALCIFLEAVDYDPPEKVNDRLPEVLDNLTARAIRHRHDADHGIWELRTGPRQQVHTKAMIWVALTDAARIARNIAGVPAEKIAEWERIAAEVRADYLDKGWCPEKQAYVGAYGAHHLDAAVLRVALFAALDPRDPRTRSTLAAIERELGAGDLVYRYRMEDGLIGDEGTFTACAFWRVGCLALDGRTGEAKAAFERLITRGNDVGLFAEEIDPTTGEQRGNTPQGFSHMALINAALRLESSIERYGVADTADAAERRAAE
ncbi:glycoside hydrolase family 15 protein [Methylobacterium sp. A49B]|uniref:Glycoside hydrolase family 15 protein n=1 Tax=Methylobacterium mesophilicum SR1.6/6 TaxID=908290 RepID=A0A6B9FG25_9HYPH|nr:glycoside hydrolase family 15 protein [Methylobacterium mesophilicum]QGY01527.1 glycoside hydrolase family 15 protein [Methylobacterium mesophilicum SR1.6/6]